MLKNHAHTHAGSQAANQSYLDTHSGEGTKGGRYSDTTHISIPPTQCPFRCPSTSRTRARTQPASQPTRQATRHPGTQADGVLATFDVYPDGLEFSHQVVLHGDGDFHDDELRLYGNRLYLLRGLRAAQLTSRGEGDESEDAIPMSIVCFELDS